MLYTSAELVSLLQRARTLNHENLMGMPHDEDRHRRMQDLHDETFDFEVSDDVALEVKPPKAGRPTEKYTTGIKAARKPRDVKKTTEYQESSLSIDEEVAQMRQRGDRRSRDALRIAVRNRRAEK